MRKRATIPLTRNRLRQVLLYDPYSGHFTRVLGTRGHAAGARAGSVSQISGYRAITIDGVPYLEQHLAWFWVHGYWPVNELDHINRVRDDNRQCNLRAATTTQNRVNSGPRCTNKLGVKGVRARGKKFMAQLGNSDGYWYLGTFDTIEKAVAAHAAKHRELYGKFSPTNP